MHYLNRRKLGGINTFLIKVQITIERIVFLWRKLLYELQRIVETIIFVSCKTTIFQPHSGIHHIDDIVVELCHIQLGFFEKIVGSVS